MTLWRSFKKVNVQQNNNIMRIAFTLLATLLLALGQGNVYGQKKFELADYAKFVSISDPQISPDGQNVVIVVTRPDYVNNRFNAELVLVNETWSKRRIFAKTASSETASVASNLQ